MFNAKLIIFSPIHIGDGEELISFEYIEDGTKIKVYPFYYFMDKIFETYQDNRLFPILTQLKEYAKGGLKGGLKEFISSMKIAIEPKYQIDKYVNVNGTNIKTFIKNLKGPYISGSEIKGALRTAFLYGILRENHALRERLYKNLEEKFNRINENNNNKFKREIEEIINNLEIEVFRPGESNHDAQYDIFKVIQISDSEPIDYNSLYVDSVKVLNSSREIRDFSEFLKAGIKVNLNIKIDKNVFEGLKSLEKFKAELHNKNLIKITFEFLKKSALEFYKDLIEEEEKFINEKIKDFEFKKAIKDQLESLRNYFKKVENTTKIVFPLRLGKHQGYLSFTIMQIVKRERPKLFNEVFKIFAPQVRSEINKTRKVLESTNKLPGWCFLHVENLEI
jgi:CRISPR-associated protein Csm5